MPLISLITHWDDDTHRDHRRVSQDVIEAAQRCMRTTEKPTELYFCTTYNGLGLHGDFAPDHYVNIEPYIDRKNELIRCFEGRVQSTGFAMRQSSMNSTVSAVAASRRRDSSASVSSATTGGKHALKWLERRMLIAASVTELLVQPAVGMRLLFDDREESPSRCPFDDGAHTLLMQIAHDVAATDVHIAVRVDFQFLSHMIAVVRLKNVGAGRHESCQLFYRQIGADGKSFTADFLDCLPETVERHRCVQTRKEIEVEDDGNALLFA